MNFVNFGENMCMIDEVATQPTNYMLTGLSKGAKPTHDWPGTNRRTYSPTSNILFDLEGFTPLTLHQHPCIRTASLQNDWTMDWNRCQQGWIFPPAYCLNNSPDEMTQYTYQEYPCFDTPFPADTARENQVWSNSNEVRPWLSRFPYKMFISGT